MDTRQKSQLKRTSDDANLTANLNSIKSPRISNFTSNTQIWHKLEERLAVIEEQNKIIIEQNELTNTKIAELIEFKLHFDDKIAAVENRLLNLETEALVVQSLKNEILDIRRELNRCENLTVASDLRINGIPRYDNENLFQIFYKICDTININRPHITSIFRLKKANRRQTNQANQNNNINHVADPTIIVRFESHLDRNFVLKSVANFIRMRKGFLCLNDIGFDSNTAIFIKENLTPCNFRILIEALRLKKQQQLSTVFSMRGIVYVKLNDTEDSRRIETLDELQNLFRTANNNNIPGHDELSQY